MNISTDNVHDPGKIDLSPEGRLSLIDIFSMFCEDYDKPIK